LAFSAAVVGYAWQQVQSNGGFYDPNAPTITWLTSDNLQDLLNPQSQGQSGLTLAPSLPVLLIECPESACKTSELDLADVTKEFAGKVNVVAFDPYADTTFFQGFNKLFVTGQIRQAEEDNLAQAVVSQTTGQPPTADLVNSVLSDPTLGPEITQQANDSQLMQNAYPKFLFFEAKDFQLLMASQAIPDKSDLTQFIDAALAQTDGAAADSSQASDGGADAAGSPAAAQTATPATAAASPAVSAVATAPAAAGTTTPAQPPAASSNAAGGPAAAKASPVAVINSASAPAVASPATQPTPTAAAAKASPAAVINSAAGSSDGAPSASAGGSPSAAPAPLTATAATKLVESPSTTPPSTVPPAASGDQTGTLELKGKTP
jgi:hypothetical protein